MNNLILVYAETQRFPLTKLGIQNGEDVAKKDQMCSIVFTWFSGGVALTFGSRNGCLAVASGLFGKPSRSLM